MWTKFMKCSFFLGVFLLAIQSFAATDLTLEELRKEVLSDNLDIRIQYEKYYQSQRNVGVALGQFLPNANINLVNINATLAVLQSVVPTPSNWFSYQASKDLKLAEKYTTESIKLNILEGLTANYINLKHQETLMESLKKQERFLEDVYTDVVKSEELGMASPNDVFLARRNLLQHRQDIFALNTLMLAEKQSLLIALNMSPNEELSLGLLPAENLEVIPEDVNEGIEMALRNSTEIRSNVYQAEAARFMVSSKKWSFVSFNGIGFDYSSTLAIERSRAKIIELEREKLALKIRNQVYSAYDELKILDQRIELQKQVLMTNEETDARNTELYMNQLITLTKYLESKNNLAEEERTLTRLEMQRLIKISHIKRLLGLDASLGQLDEDSYANIGLMVKKTEKRNRNHLALKLNGTPEELANVMSVTYSLKDIFETTSDNASNQFAIYYRLKSRGEFELVARIRLMNGEEVIKTERVVLK